MLNIGGEEFETRKVAKKGEGQSKKTTRCWTGKIEQFIIPCNKAGWLLALSIWLCVLQ
jgi:hypothetical protein